MNLCLKLDSQQSRTAPEYKHETSLLMNMDRMQVIKYCMGSGFCAAAASAVGKLATDPMFLWSLILEATHVYHIGCADSISQKCKHALSIDPGSVIYLSCQAVLFAFMLLINSFMWTLFSKALSASGSTIEASVMNMGFNFFFTALFSFLIFGESDNLNWQWLLGSVIMLIGLLLLNSDHQKVGEERPDAGKNADADFALPKDGSKKDV